MSLIKCPECSKEISDLVESCPHCGFPIGFGCPTTNSAFNNMNNDDKQYNNQQTSYSYTSTDEEKQKMSVLGILALVFSILGCTFIIGTILAIIDLANKDGKKKVCSIIALVICGFWLLVVIIGSVNSDTKNEEVKSVVQIEDASTKAQENKEEQKETGEELGELEEDSFEKENVLNTGIYIIGEDLIAGKYDLTAIKGSGSVKIYNSYDEYLEDEYGVYAFADYDMKEENASVGMLNEDVYSQTISNIRLEDGQCLIIEKGLEIEYNIE